MGAGAVGKHTWRDTGIKMRKYHSMWIVICLNCFCLQQLFWCCRGGWKCACLSMSLCVFSSRCIHLLLCSVYRADGHSRVVNNICLMHMCVSVLCLSWDGKRKGFGPLVEGSLNPSPSPGLDSLRSQVWLQFARCLHVQIYDLSWLCWTKEGIEGRRIHWTPSSPVPLRAT